MHYSDEFRIFARMKHAAAAIIAAMALTGCSPRQLPPAIRERTVTRHDTVVARDSVFILDADTIYVNGDTVMETHWRTRYITRWAYRASTDTATARDTVTVTETVEAEPSAWDTFRMGAFYVLAAAVAILAAVVRAKT